jgi:hypothetical protein
MWRWAMDEHRGDRVSTHRRRKDQRKPDEWIRAYVEADERYQEACERARKFTPKEEVDYQWAAAYALRAYEWYSHAVDQLDQKADNLIGYLGGGVGLLSLATAVLSLDRSRVLGLLLAPSIFLALWAVRLAAKARAPALLPFPPLPEDAIEYAEFFKTEQGASGPFAALIHSATVACLVALDAKGDRIRSATRRFTWAVSLLVLPVLGALLLPYLGSVPSGLHQIWSGLADATRQLVP